MSKYNDEEHQSSNLESSKTPHSIVTEKVEPTLIAYCLHSGEPMSLVPASSARLWMNDTRFANRCLPLLIANQAGWFVLSSHALRATWSGNDDLASLQIDYLSGSPPYPALSHFGYGILTWHLPYLFRTSPGYNLLVRGPANWLKDGAVPLEGLIETDWAVATFTMNWKLTRSDFPITFDVGEPICMIVPQRRGELEAFQTEIRSIESEAEIEQGYNQWSQSRGKFLDDLKMPGSEAARRAWQKDYFRGIAPDKSYVPEHQLKLKLRNFNQEEPFTLESDTPGSSPTDTAG